MMLNSSSHILVDGGARRLGPPAGASLYLEHFCPFVGVCGGSLAYIVEGQVTGKVYV